MGALDAPNLWRPQDDILLKNSIEAGASLESLAKGAVEFSQKFTIKELQDRWRSLLYDPAVSLEACARMAEFELSTIPSKSKKVNISKESKSRSAKRKYESIRSSYYAMRKRVSPGPLCQGDLRFLINNSYINDVGDNVVKNPLANGFGLDDCNLDGSFNVSPSVLGNKIFIGQQNMLEDPMDQNIVINEEASHKEENCNMIGETCLESLSGHNFFVTNDIEAKPACNDKDSRFSECGTSYEHIAYSSSLPETVTWKTVENMLLSETPDGADITGNSVQTEGRFDIVDDNDAGEGILEDGDMHFDYFADMTDLKFTEEDEITVAADRNDEIDETCHNGLNTHLLNTLAYVTDDEVCDMPEINEPTVVVPADTNSGTITLKGDFAETNTSDSNFQSCSVNMTSMSVPTSALQFPEYHSGVICCVLNTEDSEIPCNDDIVFPAKKPASSHRRTQNRVTVASTSKDGACTETIEKGKISHPTQSSDVEFKCGVDKRGVEIETLRSDKCTAVKNEYPNLPGCDISKQVELSVGGMNQIQSASNIADPMLEEANEELVSSENEEECYDSDADIPSFSDVESMILDKDLGPADQHPLSAAKVAKYQLEDAKKVIIRLEQNARSYMQRDLASHGAFAVLIGRHSKYYIKKPMVLLGRATSEVNVDVDLTREGHATRISRRQACIKLHQDGSFSLKNLGDRVIYVNGEKIPSGNRIDLSSNCLIDIRGIGFLFQVNQRRVQLYLDEVVQ